MAAGLALTVALALLVWAITPSTGGGPEPLLRGALATFVLAHFGDVRIGSAELTMTPLLLPLLFGLILAVGAGRGRVVGATAEGEAVSIGSGALTYGVLVTVVAVLLAPTGARDTLAGLWALILALIALGLGMLWRGEALRSLIVGRLPGWVLAAILAGTATVAALLAGAALAVVASLVASFSTAAELTDTLARGVGEGIGLTLAAAGFVPNMVLAGLGYVSGVGFQVGRGRYSAFGSVLTDLPPFPPFAAVPAAAGASIVGVVALLIPVAAGLAAGVVLIRRVPDRRERPSAVLLAAGVAGVFSGVLVWLGGGGVRGGAWAQIGALGWQVGLIAAAAVLVVAGTWVLAAGYGAAAGRRVRQTRTWLGRRDRTGAADLDAGETGADDAGLDDVGAGETGADDAGAGQTGAEDVVPDGSGAGQNDADADADDAEAESGPHDAGLDGAAGPDDAGAGETGADDAGAGETDPQRLRAQHRPGLLTPGADPDTHPDPGKAIEPRRLATAETDDIVEAESRLTDGGSIADEESRQSPRR